MESSFKINFQGLVLPTPSPIAAANPQSAIFTSMPTPSSSFPSSFPSPPAVGSSTNPSINSLNSLVTTDEELVFNLKGAENSTDTKPDVPIMDSQGNRFLELNGMKILLPPMNAPQANIIVSRPLVKHNIPDSWSVEDMINNLPPPFGWERIFEESKYELIHISNLLKTLGPFYPKKADLFRAFELTPLADVRVVLIGQDPYPQNKDGSMSPRAQGLSFSFARDDPVPGNCSLHNMFVELQDNYKETFRYPAHGDLSSWARQGMLMLNTCLTVAPGQPGSHMGKDSRSKQNLWKPFLIRILNAINQRNQRNNGTGNGNIKMKVKPIYVLLGGKAQDLKRDLGTYCEKVIFVEATHPSPQSAHSGFFGSKIFLKINRELRQMGEPEIDWNLT